MVVKYPTTLAGDERLGVVNFRLSLPPLPGQFSVITIKSSPNLISSATLRCLNPLESGQSFESEKEAALETLRNESQSPRIGAVIRISVISCLWKLLKMCLNPLESGQSFEWNVKGKEKAPTIKGLNPLELGQSFELKERDLVAEAQAVSQSPRIGAVIRIRVPARKEMHHESCLNPLESGQSFEYVNGQVKTWKRDPSQSPRIGAVIRKKTGPGHEKHPLWCLNPLESGQSFE